VIKLRYIYTHKLESARSL